MKSKSLVIVVLAGILSMTGCGGIKMPPDGEVFYRVEEPDKRVKDQAKYFKHEYEKICKKRETNSKECDKPKKLVGLGLSGGGIRSSAYQLGLLSGLQKSKSKDKTVLDKIDYLSCVSGGCWAAGAFLIAKESTETLFGCLDDFALKGKACGRAENILRNEQPIELAKTDTKEEWEEDIRKAYFPNECKEFQFADRNSQCWKNMKGKPYVIFNVTHSTLSPTKFGADINNLPFQITPDEVGSVADCGSYGIKCGDFKEHGAGKDKIGFFVRHDADNFKWVRRERSAKTLWLKLETEPGSQMSKAMAHSSAVIGTPKELSFSMGLTYNGEFPSEEIRDNYFLTDGGFVENLGLLSLVERGADLIVLSDMGYPEREGEDLKIAIDQVQKLLKCEVKNVKNGEPISELQYTCKEPTKDKPYKEGKILYIRPLQGNIKDFKEALKQEQPELFACIEDKTHRCYGKKPKPFKTPDENSDLEEKYRFPTTDTFLETYDKRLIRAYYMLGKFIGEHHVAQEIEKQ